MLKNKLILSLSALSLCSVFLFSACGEKKSASVSSSASAISSETGKSTEKIYEGISVNKGVFSVEIILPTALFTDMTEDEVIATAKEKGINAKKNDDDSYTYKMSKSNYKKFLESNAEKINTYIADMSERGTLPGVEKIEPNENYENFKVYVDNDEYSYMVSRFAELELYMYSVYYHALKGENTDKFQIHLTTIDNSNNSEISTDVYPTDEMLQQSETGSNQ